MREIKFRAWDKLQEEMHTPAALIVDTGGMTKVPLHFASEDNTAVFMQYTGLKDKNGKEIYEGDILRNRRGDLSVVKWAEDYTGFDPFHEPDAAHTWFDSQVIGNHYENPELI